MKFITTNYVPYQVRKHLEESKIIKLHWLMDEPLTCASERPVPTQFSEPTTEEIYQARNEVNADYPTE